MKKIISLFTLVFLLSCDYVPPYSGVVLITLNENLTEWDADDGISILETTSDTQVKLYNLGLINILNEETTTYSSGSTGEWVASSPIPDKIGSPSIFSNVVDPDNPDNKLLLLEFKREPLAEYIYYPLIVDSAMSGYILRYDYRDLSKLPVPIYLSVGTNLEEDDISSFTREVVVQRESATAVETLSFINPGTYQIRFGNADINNIIPTFSIYLDNVYIFKNSNHAISQRVNIKEAGTYKIVVNAKAYTSNIMTVKISGYSRTFNLTDSMVEYCYFIRLDRGDTTIEIMPVDSIISNRIPGSITICPPVLEFHPDKSDLE